MGNGGRGGAGEGEGGEALLCRVLVVIKDVFEDYLDIYSQNITRRASRITWTNIHKISLVMFLVNGLRDS